MVIPGWLTLWLAVIADTGGSLLVTLNRMRLLREKSETRPAAVPGKQDK